MRWLFLFVLVLNLAYIVWQTSLPATEMYAEIAPIKDDRSNIRSIVLLSEIPSPAVEATEKASKPQAEKLPAEKIAQAGTEKEDRPAVEAAPVESMADNASEPTAQVAAKEKFNAETPPVTTRSQGGCFTLGPFRDLDKLRALTRSIKSYVKTADFRGREEKAQSLYWVYVKPENSHKKAVATGKRLKSKKIKDFYIIRDGEKKNGLSLGHFRNKAGAYGLAKKVTSLGFDVLVEPVFKTYTVYWLDYQLDKEKTMPDSLIEQYIKADGKAGNKDKISRLSRECV